MKRNTNLKSIKQKMRGNLIWLFSDKAFKNGPSKFVEDSF